MSLIQSGWSNFDTLTDVEEGDEIVITDITDITATSAVVHFQSTDNWGTVRALVQDRDGGNMLEPFLSVDVDSGYAGTVVLEGLTPEYEYEVKVQAKNGGAWPDPE